MTTIAYRDGVLAADSQSNSGRGLIVPGSAKKVHAIADGRLVAFSGAFAEGVAFVRALEKGLTELPVLNETTVLIVQMDGSLILHEGETWHEQDGEFYAMGTGAAAALGAMHAGADAVKAVEAACKVDPNSGGRVHAFRIGQNHA